jgi:hypothetical protein
MQSFALTSLSRELREVRTKIAELEGLYKQTVNVNIGGQEGNELKLTIQRGGDGES